MLSVWFIAKFSGSSRTFLDETEGTVYFLLGAKPPSLDLSQRMLSFGAEYVNVNVLQESLEETVWTATKATKITEFAEGTL